jgi:hypothetical protein
VKFYRDGYNATNLDVGWGPFRARFSAIDEPWDGPLVRLIVELGQKNRRFFHAQFSWG